MFQPNIVHNILLLVIGILLLLICLNPHERHKMIDGKLHKAWHIQLPGYVETYYPEHIIHLKDWAGSSYSGITVTVDGLRNAEIEAEPVVRLIGLATEEYVREEVDGHWVLRRPEKITKQFSYTAYYRVSKYTPDNN